MTIGEYLSTVDYPGRIIMFGAGPDGKHILLYALTGRSPNSRNRVLRLYGGDLWTEAYDESAVADPSLIIYKASARAGKWNICSNGSHTDVIAGALMKGGDITDALVCMEAEPDAPSFTPRISMVSDDDGYTLSIVRKEGEEMVRLAYHYRYEKGTAHVIHTYDSDGDPLPSFSSAPVRVSIPSSDVAGEVWASLRKEYRVALYLRAGESETIINAMEDSDGEA